MRVIIMCERSGVVREAFRRRGHEAYSCDLAPADDGEQEFHIENDCFHPQLIAQPWDLMIAHPPCTYLSVSGLHWNKRGRMVDGRPRSELTEEAVEFFQGLLEAPIPRIAIENPVGCISTLIRKPDQYIQPYQFGEDASKKTGLWLRGLPKLIGTKYVEPRLVCDNCKDVFKYGQHKCPSCGSHEFKPRWSNQTDSGQNRLGPSDDRAMIRAKTYSGIAEAMAEQWGGLKP